MEMYVCLIHLRQYSASDSAIYTSVKIAENEDKAINQAIAEIIDGESLSGTSGFVVEHASATQIDRDLIKEAARIVLGWESPTT